MMSAIRIFTMAPVLIFLAVNEFTVMMVLPILGIADGPLKYLIDAFLLVVLSLPVLYLWAKGIVSPLPGRVRRDPDAVQILPLEELERQALMKALGLANGDRTRAARLLGISRATIYRKVKRLALDKPRILDRV